MGLAPDLMPIELDQADLDALKHIDKKITLGVGVIDIKVNHIETADEVAAREAIRRVACPVIEVVHVDLDLLLDLDVRFLWTGWVGA